MNKYNSKAKCSKCQNKIVSTGYCKEPRPLEICWSFKDSNNKTIEGEHIHRRCQRCAYQWLEAVVSLN